MKKLGVLTIGQSPRLDISPLFTEVLDNKVEVVERGALDSLDEEGLKNIQPRKNDTTYVSKLRNGAAIKINKDKLLPLLQKELDFLEDEVDMTMMLCTGDFPELSSNKLILFPDKILNNIVNIVLNNGKLGLIIPLEEQKEKSTKKWRNLNLPLEIEASSPYENGDFKTPAMKLKERGVSLIVMDCMGYSKQQKEIVSYYSSLPVILSQSLVFSIAKEFSV